MRLNPWNLVLAVVSLVAGLWMTFNRSDIFLPESIMTPPAAGPTPVRVDRPDGVTMLMCSTLITSAVATAVVVFAPPSAPTVLIPITAEDASGTVAVNTVGLPTAPFASENGVPIDNVGI